MLSLGHVHGSPHDIPPVRGIKTRVVKFWIFASSQHKNIFYFSEISNTFFPKIRRNRIHMITPEPVNACISDPILHHVYHLSLIHISEPTRQAEISYAVFCLKKK